MSKKIKLVLSFDITDELFNSEQYEDFKVAMAESASELKNNVNTSTMLPGCSNVEILVD